MEHYIGEWEKRYELGMQDIDSQHKFFFELIWRLLHELEREDKFENRFDLVREIKAFAIFHFISEENMMRRANYPDLGKHRAIHDALIQELSDKEDLFFITADQSDEQALIGFLIHWFFDHANEVDSLFVDYLRHTT